jgi:homoserine O-succinyltransferase
MPKKIETETQLLRLLSKSPIQIHLDFMSVGSHQSRNTSADHLLQFYETFDALRDRNYDGLIVTGAPVEHLPFEEVDYWDELCRIIDWSHEHVYSTLYICWGSLAGLYRNYGIAKTVLPSKLFGVFKTRLCDEYNFLTNGFDEVFHMPHSRYAGFDTIGLAQQVLRHRLQILADSPVTGPSVVATPDMREIYITGHLEYGKTTLSEEYARDLAAGKLIEMPRNYYPDDDPGRDPVFSWRSAANLLYRNWVDYVYQMTPFDLNELTADYHGYRCEERIWLPGARFSSR